MYLEKNLEKKWLIKSENKILGPYNFDQIIDLLRKKQISVIDEVRDPETRWLYVRENNEFKNIVEEIRKEIDSRQESTKTYQSNAGTYATGVTNSATNAAPAVTEVEEVTAQKTRTDILVPLDNTNVKASAQEAEVVNETVTPSYSSPVYESPLQRAEKPRIYGLQNDTAVQNKITDYSLKLKIGLAVLVVLVISSVFGYLYIQKRSVVKKEEELVLQVKRLKYLGLYDKAAEAYATLPEPSKTALLPSLLDMYPVLQKSGGVTMDEVKALKTNTNLTAEQRANIELIGFWTAVKALNYGQAQEYLTRAIGLQPVSYLLKENDAWLNVKSNQAKKAYDQFKTLYNNEKNGRYLYGMVISYQGLPVNDKNQVGKELLQLLERYTIQFFNLKKELLMAQIYLEKEQGEEANFSISVKQFLNTPVQMANEFTKPSLLIPDVINWKELDYMKDSVLAKVTGDDGILFQMHLLLEGNQLTTATNFLKVNESKVTTPEGKAQLNLLLLNAQSRSKDIMALAQSHTLDAKNELNNFILALNQIKIDPKRNISEYTSKMDPTGFGFYRDWLELAQLIAKNSSTEINAYLKDHFLTIDDFNPVFEARNLVN
ncbi:MAG: hypothetical protein ACXWQQ_06270 [Pseudobdellovibrio sp.]